MSSRADREKQLNDIDTANVEFCETLTSSYTLEEFFPDDPYLVAVFKNYRSRKLNELTLFWCVLVSIMHWSSETKLFDKEVSDYINLNLYGILRGNSVSHKSGYIRPIRDAFDFVERYFRSQFLNSDDEFTSTCIESTTPAKLLIELQSSSKFISSDEDRPLTDLSFFEPTTPLAKAAQPLLISAFNGAYKLQRSTMTYSKEIRDKSLTMLVPTTGDQWISLLEHFANACQTNGLYERILYWIIGKKNFIYDKLPLNEELPCLEYLFITRMLIGKRVYEYDDQALQFLQPILKKMRANGPSCDGLFDIPKNKRAESCERRGADLIERISAIIQNIFDVLNVLKPIKSINFNSIKKDTLNQIKTNIGNYFYSNEMLSQVSNNLPYFDDIDLKELDVVQISSIKKAPLQTMKVGLRAAKIAVNLFHKLLLPQSIQLFSVDYANIKKSMLNELKIIQFPVNCFSLSDLTCGSGGIFHNQKRDNIDVKQLLSNLEKKRLLKYGKFIKSSFRTLDSWIKMLPDPTNTEDIQQYKKQLYADYQLDFEKYVNLYEQSIDDKSLLTETAQDILTRQRSWIQEIQYKINNPSAQETNSDISVLESVTDSFVVLPQMQQTTCTNYVQDMIDFVDNKTIESIDVVQTVNLPSIIEDRIESFTENNPSLITADVFLSNSIRNCLEDIIEQVVDLTNTNSHIMIDSIAIQHNTISHMASSTYSTSIDCLITEDMKSLCKKILLIDSIILSSTKLNKACKINMVDVHKACRFLIENGLLTKEKKMLANKSSYYECYLKRIPYDKSELVDFSFTLAKFGIVDISIYYDTLKTIDTKNNTYLSPNGLSMLEQKPYSDLNIIVNKDAITQPSKERYHELADGLDIGINNKENEIIDDSTTTQQNLEHVVANPKRRRELTGKAKEYKDQQSKTKRKKH